MKFLHTVVAAALLTAALAQAQTSAGAKPLQKSQTATTATMPLTEGEVKKIDKAQGLVVLKHGYIPNLGMPAMTMGFNAEQPILDRFKLGDKVRFNAEMVKGNATITRMEISH